MTLTGLNADIYTRLWFRNSIWDLDGKTIIRPSADAVCARYWLYGLMPDGQAAYFALSDGSLGPHIRIGRERVPAPAFHPDLNGATLLELMSLAHERGHEASWRNGTYAPGAMPEERRAWDLAEAMLRELSFEDWEEFRQAKQFSLEEHRRLGTPE